MCDNEDGTAVKRWTVRPLVFVVGYREGLPPDSSKDGEGGAAYEQFRIADDCIHSPQPVDYGLQW